MIEFTEEERNSALWKKLKEHWEDRLHRLRQENDKSKPDLETEKLRGKIAELKENIELDKPRKNIEVD